MPLRKVSPPLIPQAKDKIQLLLFFQQDYFGVE